MKIILIRLCVKKLSQTIEPIEFKKQFGISNYHKLSLNHRNYRRGEK